MIFKPTNMLLCNYEKELRQNSRAGTLESVPALLRFRMTVPIDVPKTLSLESKTWLQSVTLSLVYRSFGDYMLTSCTCEVIRGRSRLISFIRAPSQSFIFILTTKNIKWKQLQALSAGFQAFKLHIIVMSIYSVVFNQLFMTASFLDAYIGNHDYFVRIFYRAQSMGNHDGGSVFGEFFQ